jgi:2-polyprenyl-3-methyl-5-hydroxy-6-metoxy-1,4-benzoquinol methylase
MECPACGFYFVANPAPPEKVYGDDYYSGRGADKLVDYVFESENPGKTIREYEFRGLSALAESLCGPLSGLSWLDFGCGTGGLMAYLRKHFNCRADGFDTGKGAEIAKKHGLEVLGGDELEKASGRYDIVSSIETLEHLEEPLEYMRRAASLLKKGGVFLFTTGNSGPFAADIMSWSYFTPEIHIALFNPKSLAELFGRAGFEMRSFTRAQKALFRDIYKFKALKNLGFKEKSLWFEPLPWGLLAAALERGHRLAALGYGVKKTDII